jgi:hypothetical protein
MKEHVFKIQETNEDNLNQEVLTPRLSESIEPVELTSKYSASNSLNQSKEKRSSRIEAKIVLSANRLSSKKETKYISEGSNSKFEHYTPKGDNNDTPSANDKNSNSGVKKYLLNMSSNQSLNINKSELELASSDEYKNTVKLQLKYSENSSISHPTPEYRSEEVSFEKDIYGFKDSLNPPVTQKNSKISKLIEQEKMRRTNEASHKKNKVVLQNYKNVLTKLDDQSNKPISKKTRIASINFDKDEVKSSTISSQLKQRLANKEKPVAKDKLVTHNNIVSFGINDPQDKLHHKSRNNDIQADEPRTQPTSSGGTIAKMPIMSTFNNIDHSIMGTDGSKINISNLLSFAKADNSTSEPGIYGKSNSDESLPRDPPTQYVSIKDISKAAKPKSYKRIIGKSSVKVFTNLKELTSQSKSLFKEFSLQGSQTTRTKKIKNNTFRKCFIN